MKNQLIYETFWDVVILFYKDGVHEFWEHCSKPPDKP